jgi:parvulin-like peptidyl-prolyl isomerase
MKKAVLITIICLIITGLPGYGSEGNLPVVDGKMTVATVNGEPIFLDEFNEAIGASHARSFKRKTAGSIDYSPIMKRLINIRLIVIEGRNMGLHELPEIIDRLDAYSRENLMSLLLEQQVKNIKADEEEVERVYKETVKEWKITAVGFGKEEVARKFEEEIKAGNTFEETVKKAKAEGIPEKVDEGIYLKTQDLFPPVARLVTKMEIGSVSPIVALDKGQFVIFRLEGIRFPEDENPETRREVIQQVLKEEKRQAARSYYSDLRERYAKFNEELIESLDYTAKEPGFEKLMKDKRVIVMIDGEEAITVAELSKALKQKFYHGVERAIASNRINQKKPEVLERILEERILLREALKEGMDKTEEFRNRVEEYERSLIFDSFVNKVIIPDIKLDIKELETYYRENKQEFMSPEMIRIKSLAFGKKSDASSAMDKLLKGADFKWVSLNAEGLMGKRSEEFLEFDGKLLTVRSLPEGVRKTLSGAKPGDFRLYSGPDGYYYVLYIYHVIPAKPEPAEEVREEIAEKIFKDKLQKAVEVYADKLREYYPVKIYAKELQ